MNDFLAGLRQWWENARTRWNKLTLNQKVILSAAVLLLVVTAGMLVSNQVRVNYEPLYTQLAVEDAAAITDKLDAAKIPYRLADEGSTILVPAGQKYRTRLMLAGEGLPRGVAGLEMFQNIQFGETETDKRVKYLAALQGELVRTIQSLDKIEAARVHLVIPEPSLYSEEETPPTASVMVKVKPGQQLDRKEILGMVNLVANSVEGLKPENVAIVDQYSNLLSFDLPSAGSLDGAEMSSQQMAIKRQFEREKQQAIQSMLDATLGPGKSVVRVSAELNFDEVERFQQDFDPEQRVVISKHSLEETSTSTTPTASASPGVDTNVPTYAGAEGQGQGSSTFEKTESTVNYEGDKVETKTRVAPGAVKRLTVAVLVDQSFAGKRDDIREAVINASGADENRNDSVSVNFMQFRQKMEEPLAPTPGWTDKYKVLLGAGVLVLALVVTWLLARRKARGKEEEEGFDMLVDEAIPVELLVERELTPEEKEKQRMREEINKLVDTNPEDVAQLIRTWMLDEKR